MPLDPTDAQPSRRHAWLMAALLCAAMLLLPAMAWLLAPRAGGFVAPPPVPVARIEQAEPAARTPSHEPRSTPTPRAPSEAKAEGPVTGSVLDPDGKPVANAYVGCDDRDKELFTNTDKEGHFKLPPQASGCKAVAHHPDFTPMERTEIYAGRDNVLRLKGAGGIEGVVVDEKGAPVPAFLLAIESFMGAGESADMLPPSSQAKSFKDRRAPSSSRASSPASTCSPPAPTAARPRAAARSRSRPGAPRATSRSSCPRAPCSPARWSTPRPRSPWSAR